VSVFICPSDISASNGTGSDALGNGPFGLASYGANAMVFSSNMNSAQYGGTPPTGVSYGAKKFPETIPDGTSKTIMFTEKAANCVGYTAGFSQSALGGNFWAYPPSFPPASASAVYNYGPSVAYSPAQISNWNSTTFLPFYPAMYQDRPPDGQCDPYAASAPHVGGVINVCMCDGSAHSVYLSQSADIIYGINPPPQTVLSTHGSWKAALTPAKRLLPIGNGPSGPTELVDLVGADFWGD
jgi:prepilin-type processing-associated H-X9-DG protein